MLSREEVLAHRVMKQGGADPMAPENAALVEWIVRGVKAGLEEAALANAPVQIPSRSAEAIGGEKILIPEDLLDFDNLRTQAFLLLNDGKRHTRTELAKVAGVECTKRARELRDIFVLKKERDKSDGRVWWYWLLRVPNINYSSLNVSRLPFATPADIAEQEAERNKS